MLKHSPEILMQIAELYAQESRATRAKVGAVLVTSTGVLIPGYNGTPSGWDNTCEADNKTLPYVLHAEMNCILKCAEEGVSTKGVQSMLRTLLAGTVQLVCLSAE